MANKKLESALAQLVEEQRALEALRADYRTVTNSRFHALRTMWFSFKHLMNLRDPQDSYGPAPTPIAVSGQAAIALPSPEPQQTAAEEFDGLLRGWSARQKQLPLSADPIVSVIIPAFNHSRTTLRCLRSLADTWFESLAVQIIVVDDASTDDTPELLAQIAGLDYIRNTANEGFIRSCNRGAAIARGKYLVFLNNDTVVQNAWLEYLVMAAEADGNVGAVGAKLVYPNGRLQEAGGIIWRDGTGWNYGRTGDPSDSRYNFVREADFCSGAALLVRADLFRTLGGFSELYLPAYYEDVDLCFGIRSLGYSVLYEPRSLVVHHEGVSSGTDITSGTKRYQAINREKFVAKWTADLERHFTNDPAMVPLAARRLRRGRTILVVDSYVPFYDKEAGSNRLWHILKLLRAANYTVLFLPDNYAGLQPYTREMQALGIEVLYHTDAGKDWQQALAEVLPLLDAAWICRPELFAKYAPLVRTNAACRRIYDTIDLHFVRMQRAEGVLGKDASGDWNESKRLELDAARTADATIVCTPEEKDVLEGLGVTNVHVVPTLHEPKVAGVRSFERSEGLLFIGGYGHTPNVDAVTWLCREIMPLVWQKLPDVKLTLLGNAPPKDVLGLASARVLVPGYLRDVESYFAEARVFVAPLRFGAGHKGKIGQSLSHGLPLVTTAVGSEGFGLADGRDCLFAETAQEFADAVVRLYTDRVLWAGISRASLDAIAPFTAAAIEPDIEALLQSLFAAETVRA